VLNKNDKDDFSDFGFISLGRVKTVKVFDTKMNSIVANRPDAGYKTSERRRAPFAGSGLFYTCAPEQIRRSQLELCETLAYRVKPVKCLLIFNVILISNKSYARQWKLELCKTLA
jgi:hypothetical protein